MTFNVQNTSIAAQLVNPVYSSTSWTPVFVAANPPGSIQFTNFNVVAAYFTQVDKVVNFSVRFTVNVAAPASEATGSFTFTPPVPRLVSNFNVGAITTLSQVGLFGNIGQTGQLLQANMVNAAGVINVVGAQMQLLGSYVVE